MTPFFNLVLSKITVPDFTFPKNLISLFDSGTAPISVGVGLFPSWYIFLHEFQDVPIPALNFNCSETAVDEGLDNCQAQYPSLHPFTVTPLLQPSPYWLLKNVVIALSVQSLGVGFVFLTSETDIEGCEWLDEAAPISAGVGFLPVW